MTWEFSPAVISKGKTLPVDETQFVNVYWVQSSSGDKSYRVQTDFNPKTRKVTWASCTCRHGMNRGGRARCAHVVAVLLRLKESSK